MRKKIGLYVHIPFCKSKCNYCNFNSYSKCEDSIDSYFKSLWTEISNVSKTHRNISVDTVYIGGGTPSFVDAIYIAETLDVIRKYYKLLPDAEISIEANPNSITLDKATIWKSAGVNRVSVGLQSSNKKVLRTIGRTHTKLDYVLAMKDLQKAGFSNINTDIMLGLPHQKIRHIHRALALVCKYTTHVSAYSLIVEEDTPIYSQIAQKRIALPHEEKTIKMYEYTHKFLAKHQLHRYEVSNFAKPGYECKHNVNCWNYRQYIGFGAGAHSFIDDDRYNNIEDINKYITAIKKEGKAVVNKYSTTREQQIEEFIMLGLRKVDGVDIKYMRNKFGYNILKEKKRQLDKLRGLGLIEVDDQVSATSRGFYVLNSIILELV